MMCAARSPRAARDSLSDMKRRLSERIVLRTAVFFRRSFTAVRRTAAQSVVLSRNEFYFIFPGYSVFGNTVAAVSLSYFEARRAEKKLAGGASHRFRPQDQPPRRRRRMSLPFGNSTALPGRGPWLRHTGGWRHRLISVGPPGQKTEVRLPKGRICANGYAHRAGGGR
jgi:hypothetical protein